MTPVDPRRALFDLIQSRRVVVCVGSGGVGKTTTSAALALHAAMAGRRVLCLTIDPARRNSAGQGDEPNGAGDEVRLLAGAGDDRDARAGLRERGREASEAGETIEEVPRREPGHPRQVREDDV